MSTTPPSDRVLSQLQSMDDYEFEYFVADLWDRQGWDTQVTQSSTDAGIDVIATKELPFSQKALIQAKRYGSTSTVGGPDIQQYASLKYQEDGVDSVIVVTTNTFSRQAQRRAEELNVKTVDGGDLVDLIERLDAYDVLDSYTSIENETTQTATGPPEEAITTWNSSSNSSKNTTDSEFSFKEVSPDTYLRFIQLGTATWSIGFALGMIGYSGGMFGSIVGILAVVGWFAFPPALYYEGQRVSEETEWTPHRKLYAIGGAFPFLNALVGGIYLYRRRRAYRGTGQESIRDTDASEEETEERKMAEVVREKTN